MILTIEKPETEARLIHFATSWGLSPDEAAEELIVLGMEQKVKKVEDARARMRALALEQAVATKALFDQWRAEEATDDPEELKRRDQEMLELRLAMNANRRETGERIPFPELETEATEREDAA